MTNVAEHIETTCKKLHLPREYKIKCLTIYHAIKHGHFFEGRRSNVVAYDIMSVVKDLCYGVRGGGFTKKELKEVLNVSLTAARAPSWDTEAVKSWKHFERLVTDQFKKLYS